ncbi:hypothetical protein LJC57_06975 [Parabacteroides sp. OttesenSCG-928-G07]|nr:hypothetical protein [Parabacteroides sp. OttesenSCG-928-G21]MDL2278319.1 hypothetical protein [Parabacteroides sp. OttesenSCG-928-G07]
MKSNVFVFSLAIVLLLIPSCNVVKELGGAYNITQCKYDYNSISQLSVSGMDLSKGVSLAHIPQLTAILSGQTSSIPLNLTLNLNVSNPNQSAALLHGMQYILNIDDIQFTTGSIDQALNIPAGGAQLLPMAIGFDLASLLKGESKNAVLNIAKNFLGVGNQSSNVTLQIKPTFMIGGFPVTSPAYIPVSFTFGGMK